VHPFGKAILEKELASAKRSKTIIIFLGRHAKSIAPVYGWAPPDERFIERHD
jgi:hypothetical protein